MSLMIEHYASNRQVWLAYALQIYNVHAYQLYEEMPDGTLSKLSPIQEYINPSSFSQGHENIVNSNSVSHVSLTGTLTVFPDTGSPAIKREVSTTPSDRRMSEYYQEYISTSDSSGEGSCSYVYYEPGSFSTRKSHRKVTNTWSMTSFKAETLLYPDDPNYKLETAYSVSFYSLEFPELKKTDIKYKSSYKYYYTNVKALAKKIDMKGVTTASQLSSVGLIKLGRLISPDLGAIIRALKLPAAQSPIPPDDLLVRLSTKTGPLRVNNLANIAQLRQLNQFLPPILKKGQAAFKTAAEFFLWYKYTIKTTESDLSTAFKYYLRGEDLNADKSKGYAHRVVITNSPQDRTLDHFTFYLGSYQQSILDKFGLRLNLENTWDLIPFSFVVDWFTKIGDMLASLDAADQWTHVPLMGFVSSRKAYLQYQLPSDLSSASANITVNSYCRIVSRELPAVIVSPDLNMPRGCLPTAVSLAIATRKR